MIPKKSERPMRIFLFMLPPWRFPPGPGVSRPLKATIKPVRRLKTSKPRLQAPVRAGPMRVFSHTLPNLPCARAFALEIRGAMRHMPPQSTSGRWRPCESIGDMS